jgi:hypothetical protein
LNLSFSLAAAPYLALLTLARRLRIVWNAYLLRSPSDLTASRASAVFWLPPQITFAAVCRDALID